MYFFYSNVKVHVVFYLFAKKTHVQEKSGSWYIPKTSTPMRMHDLYTSELYTISHEVEAGS